MAAGRSRTFDKQLALESAMRVFWSKGYAGSSLTDLTAAMGINKPSMYAAFGNKEQLFIKSMQNYIEKYAVAHAKLLDQTGLTVEQKLSHYFLSIINGQCGESEPLGCFITASISESISDDFPVAAQAQIAEIKSLSENVLVDFLTQAQADKELSQQHDVVQLAQYFISVVHGTAALARAGKSKQELTAVIQTALRVLV